MNIIPNKQFIFCFTILSLFCLISCHKYRHNPTIKELNVPYIFQEQSYWCWAACSQMVMQYMEDDSTYLQCKQALRALRIEEPCIGARFNCCIPDSIPCGQECNHTNWPIFDEYGFKCNDTYTTNDYLSWKDMLKQIDNGRPLCLTYNWTGGGAHMIVMDGYKIEFGRLYDHLLDPFSYFAETNNINYRYPTIRYMLHDENRISDDHYLGRCYYNLEKI